MENRPKRNINKPSRYETTSSDEAPRKKTTTTKPAHTTGMIDEDIEQIRTMLSSERNTNIIETQTQTTQLNNSSSNLLYYIQFYTPITYTNNTLHKSPNTETYHSLYTTQPNQNELHNTNPTYFE
ncbi:hypothetical protein PUN28_008262 [Cardiocondyla obscurior]|uniref:Uncharacterized protein n=1 Tax=Cardiocondyla obscurior TaxID=286306 RepID=A0AAW2G311_9HYME